MKTNTGGRFNKSPRCFLGSHPSGCSVLSSFSASPECQSVTTGAFRPVISPLLKILLAILEKLSLDGIEKIYIIKFRIILKMVLSVVTKYGKKILEIVSASRSHMTAEEIFDTMRQTYPTVVLATVYNNLNRLWQEDRIRKVSVEGMPDRYDRIQRHDHLVCKRCGRLLDIDLGDLTEQLEQKAGISILSYDLKLTYLCEDCSKNKT